MTMNLRAAAAHLRRDWDREGSPHPESPKVCLIGACLRELDTYPTSEYGAYSQFEDQPESQAIMEVFNEKYPLYAVKHPMYLWNFSDNIAKSGDEVADVVEEAANRWENR